MRAAYGTSVSAQVHIGPAPVTPVINARGSIRTPFSRESLHPPSGPRHAADESRSDLPGLVTVAGHPNDDLAPGTLRSILRQAELEEQ